MASAAEQTTRRPNTIIPYLTLQRTTASLAASPPHRLHLLALASNGQPATSTLAPCIKNAPQRKPGTRPNPHRLNLLPRLAPAPEPPTPHVTSIPGCVRTLQSPPVSNTPHRDLRNGEEDGNYCHIPTEPKNASKRIPSTARLGFPGPACSASQATSLQLLPFFPSVGVSDANADQFLPAVHSHQNQGFSMSSTYSFRCLDIVQCISAPT